MLGPDSGQRAKTIGGFDVSHNANNHHWWSLDNGDGFNYFLLVDF
jgi:hypothetical protein